VSLLRRFSWFLRQEYSAEPYRVEGEIVSGLKYLQVVKRAGMTVDKTEAMLGSYGPQQEEYTKIVSFILHTVIHLPPSRRTSVHSKSPLRPRMPVLTSSSHPRNLPPAC
jgi:hypothetical protein